MFINTTTKVNYTVYHNDTALFTSPYCINELYESMLYWSNQTEWYHAVAQVSFYLEPDNQEITQIQRISGFTPSYLEDGIHLAIFVFVAWYIILRPMTRMLEDCMGVAKQIKHNFKVDEITPQMVEMLRERKTKKHVKAHLRQHQFNKQKKLLGVSAFDVFWVKYVGCLGGLLEKPWIKLGDKRS